MERSGAYEPSAHHAQLQSDRNQTTLWTLTNMSVLYYAFHLALFVV